MNANPVARCNHIIYSQIEYNTTTQVVVVRCILESLTTGQRHGFTDVDALLEALRKELMEMQTQIVMPD